MTCPMCGHCHPGGIGADWCGCSDCGLLWTSIPFEHLAPEYQNRLTKLREEVRP